MACPPQILPPIMPETLRQCLASLVSQCEGICEENEQLRMATLSLTSSVSTTASPSSWLEGVYSADTFSLLPGKFEVTPVLLESTTLSPKVARMQKRFACGKDESGEKRDIETTGSRPPKHQTWKDCTELHPSALDGGEMTLAS